jgi:hypothetical protein
MSAYCLCTEHIDVGMTTRLLRADSALSQVERILRFLRTLERNECSCTVKMIAACAELDIALILLQSATAYNSARVIEEVNGPSHI